MFATVSQLKVGHGGFFLLESNVFLLLTSLENVVV